MTKNLSGKIILSALVILFFFFYYLGQVNKLPLYPDEHDWVRKSDYFDFYIGGKFNDPIWNYYDAQDQPKLTNYFFGGLFHLFGWKKIGQQLTKIDFNQGWQRPQSYGFLWTDNNWWIKYQGWSPSKIPIDFKIKIDPIILMRRVNIGLSLLTIFLIFIIGKKISNFLVGLLAMLLVGFNPLFISTTLRAMADGLLFFLLTLSLLLIIIFVDFWNKKRHGIIVVSAISGLVNGLASATKLDGLITEIIFIFICILLIFKNEKMAIKSLLVSLFFTICVFISLDPFLWSNPVAKFGQMLVHRSTIIYRQQQVWSEAALTNPWQRFLKIYNKMIIPGAEFSTFRFTKLPFDLTLVFIGIFFIVKKVKQTWKQEKFSILSVIILWCAIIFLMLLFMLPLDWERYYLPLVLPVIILEAYALGFLAKKLF